jgi:hypothetical protein
MADADKPLQCSGCGSDKHVNRVISTFAVLGGGRATGGENVPVVAGGGGGCCGGACGCGA